MKHMLFDQDRKFLDLLRSHESASIDTKIDRMEITGHPEIRFGGQSEQIHVVLRIEKIEVITVYHPLAMVDERPASGNCTMEPGKRCEFRRTDGKCTSDPFDNEKCEFNDGHCDE